MDILAQITLGGIVVIGFVFIFIYVSNVPLNKEWAFVIKTMITIELFLMGITIIFFILNIETYF